MLIVYRKNREENTVVELEGAFEQLELIVPSMCNLSYSMNTGTLLKLTRSSHQPVPSQTGQNHPSV